MTVSSGLIVDMVRSAVRREDAVRMVESYVRECEAIAAEQARNEVMTMWDRAMKRAANDDH